MACECLSCEECKGSGHVWFAFPGPDLGGRYLGNHRSDDLDELETCMECGGSGITEICYECQCATDDDADAEWEARQQMERPEDRCPPRE